MQEFKNFEKLIENIEKTLEEHPYVNEKRWNQLVRKYRKDDNTIISKNELLKYVCENSLNLDERVLESMKMKPTRTISGVTPITIFTKPFKCSGACIFCPSSPNTPKSYLKEEPGIQRAISLKYNPYKQTELRIKALSLIGHNTEKIELIISGGTWDDYDKNYRLWFVMESYRALNSLKSEVFDEKDFNYFENLQELKNLQNLNEKSKLKNVGLCIETRPDKILLESVKEYRTLGVTKVQVGIQSLDEEILKANSRGHDTKKTFEAIDLLRTCGFKIHIHWMCNLYKSNPQKDYVDFKKVWKHIKPDEIKIYPCSVTKNTKLSELYKQGKFTPYSHLELVTLIKKCKELVPNYCRINRLIRDIPSNLIEAGNKITNLREEIIKTMEKPCICIRCREIKREVCSFLNLKTTKYKTPVSTEYFLEFVNENNKIAGFLRLSILKKLSPLIKSKAIVREVHIYGSSLKLSTKSENSKQHKGLGTKLLLESEKITRKHNLDRIAVISATGTREYYKKRGYVIEKRYGYAFKKFSL